MPFASVGSISHGTLRTEDLLDAFAYELEYHVSRNPAMWVGATGRKERDRLMALIGEAREIDADKALEEGNEDSIERAHDLCLELSDALNDFAPPYCYFGAHEGDGSDFGFWPCMDQIEELTKISDPSDVADHLGEPCAFVNDHGNVTVYAADGTVVLELV
jgi:hypothetical protein